MTSRTRRETMHFPAPFTVPGFARTIPAGAYEVETEDELLEQLSFRAWHRLSTTIRIPTGAASYQLIQANPADLEAAGGRVSE